MSTFLPNQSVKLTKTVIDKLPTPVTGQHLIRDRDLKGFGLRVTTSGAKAFILEKRISGRVRRLTLGRYGELTCEQARKLAQKTLGQIAMGGDPAAEKQRTRVQGTTLAQAFAAFLKARKTLKPKTCYEYGRFFAVAFPDWQKKPLMAITKTMVAKRHRDLGETRGEAYANGSLRFLRSVFNFAAASYEDGTGHALIPENPVSVLSQTRAWYRSERRRTVIKVYELPVWYRAVNALRSGNGNGADVADYLELLLFTGLRKSEALKLKWDDVDLRAGTLTVADPKNHEPLVLPLSDHLHALLTRRQYQAVNDYVFPGRDGMSYLVEPKRQIAHVIATSGVSFTLHDLRRTFITVAESLDIQFYTIKRLINHKMTNDVTAGYIISDVERLRGPVNKITDYLLKCTGAKQSAEVLEFGAQVKQLEYNQI